MIGAKDELKGQTPIGFVVLKAGVDRAESEIAAELVALMRERIGPVAAFKDARVVQRLPKTRSGKILRASIRKIADGEAAPVPPTIEDPAALEEIARVAAALRAGQAAPRRCCGAGSAPARTPAWLRSRRKPITAAMNPVWPIEGISQTAERDRDDAAGNLRCIAAPQRSDRLQEAGEYRFRSVQRVAPRSTAATARRRSDIDRCKPTEPTGV